VAEQLEFTPASFRVIRHVLPKLACSYCDAIVQAPAPRRPIEHSITGPGLLAHILVAKFADHLPLYRQSVIYARERVDLNRAQLASWVGAASALLRPLVDAIRHHVLAASKLHADDTPLLVLAPGNGKTKTARLWAYVRDDRPCAAPRSQRSALPTRPTARASIRSHTWPTSKACCQPTHTRDSTPCSTTARSAKRRAGRIILSALLSGVKSFVSSVHAVDQRSKLHIKLMVS
jgi:transposase